MMGDRPRTSGYAPAPPTGALVLLVDDTRVMLDMYSRMLELAGYRVRAESSGKAALAALEQVEPDLIVLD
jgi:CheY-like chemotaxis protein